MTAPPGDRWGDRRPTLGPDGGSLSNLDRAGRSNSLDGTPDVAADVEVHFRCVDARPCQEVAARVVAGQVAIHVDGDVAEGDRLLAAARRIADLHGHGSGSSSVDEAS